MQDLSNKISDGGATAAGILTSSEWNQIPTEIQNVITSSGITLSVGDLQQLVKAISLYASAGQFYIGSGSVNAYVASTGGSRVAPDALVEGLLIRMVINTTNTGASTLNAFGSGVLDIKLNDGTTDVASGDLIIDTEYNFVYRTAPSPNWEVISTGFQAATTSIAGIIELATSAEVDAGADNSRAVTSGRLHDLVFDNVNTFTKQQITPSVALTDQATIAWDLDLEPNATVEITANRAMGLPTNLRNGNIVTLAIKQGTGGSRLISSYNAAFEFGDKGTPTLSTAVGDIDVLSFQVVSTTKLRFLGIATGFAN